MALADIRKKIEDEARAKAEALLADARETAAKIEAKAQAEIDAVKAKYAEQFKAEAPEIQRRADIVAGLDVNRVMLGAKQELLSRAFRLGHEALCALDDDSYRAFCEQLLKQAVVTGSEEVLVGSGDERLSPEWLKDANSRNGWSLTLQPGASEVKGGFILRRGQISENCSFDTLVRWLKDELEPGLAARLFAD